MSNWGGYKKIKMTKTKYTPTNSETLKDVLQYPIMAWPDRKISKEVMEKFGVRTKMSEFDGSVEKVYFPSYDQTGKLVGFKRKDLTRAGENLEYCTIGKVGVKNQLFGAKVARTTAKYLVITEGESDCLSAYQAIIDYFRSFKEFNEDLTPAVVTFNCGTVQSVQNLSHNERFLEKFQEFRLVLDNDELTEVEKLTANSGMRGAECTEAIGCYLLTHDSVGGRRSIKVVNLDEEFNDCSDYVQNNRNLDLAKKITNQKELDTFSAKKIISVEDITIEQLLRPKEKGVYIDTFPQLMEKLWGIRKRELTVFTALSGCGKTVCASEIAYKLAEQTNDRIALIYLEENSDETLMRMIARRLKVNYYKFVFEPLKYCNRKQFEEAYEWVKGKFFFMDIFGALTPDQLMNSFKSLYYVSNCGYIILDHLGMLGGQKGLVDERRMIDETMTELAAFTAQTDVGIIAISHLSRQAQSEIGKLSDIKEAKWINVRKEHLKGSSALEQLAWNVIALDMLLEPNRERSDVRLTVLKNRSIGLLGTTDQFHLDQNGLVELTNNQQAGY